MRPNTALRLPRLVKEEEKLSVVEGRGALSLLAVPPLVEND